VLVFYAHIPFKTEKNVLRGKWSSLLTWYESDRDGNWELYPMSSDGSDQVRITSNSIPDSRPSWSPDGNQIIYSSARGSNYEIYVIDLDGTNQIRLTKTDGKDVESNWYWPINE
jgi:Tol biopolymer transport system component